MNAFAFISNIFRPAVDLIDAVHTSDEERRILKNQLQVIENEIHSKLIAYETQLLESKTSIINSEAQGESWIQRNWRPITMLTFLALVVFDSFDLLAFRLADEAWTLLQLGLGGYVVGRSAEKLIKQTKFSK